MTTTTMNRQKINTPKKTVASATKQTATPTRSEFLAAFFPDSDEQINLRFLCPREGNPKEAALDDDDYKAWPRSRTVTRTTLTGNASIQGLLTQWNKQRGAYFVVNAAGPVLSGDPLPGGYVDQAITGGVYEDKKKGEKTTYGPGRFTACFAECDDKPISEQHAMLDNSPLPPSIRVETRKSVHAYWLLSGDNPGDTCEADWREVQARFISYFGSDDKIKNPARLMRVPGFQHLKLDKVTRKNEATPVCVVAFEPERRYTLAELLTAFPPIPDAKPKTPRKKGKKSKQNAGSFADWEALRAEAGDRIKAHPTASENPSGNWDCQGICHNGEGNTGLFYDPVKNYVHCNSGCDQETILRAFNLPKEPNFIGEDEDEQSSQPNNNPSAQAQSAGQANTSTSSSGNASSSQQAQAPPTAGKRINQKPITRTIKGFEFTADDTGVWVVKNGKKKTKICSPLFIEADTRNARGEGWGRLLIFYDRDGREKSWVMPRSWLAGNRSKYREKLLDMGLLIEPGRRAETLLHFYLHDQPGTIALSVDRVGWADDAFVLPDQTIRAQTGEPIYLQASGVNNLLRTSGTLSQWRQSIGQNCIGNSRLVFGVSGAFAASLLTPFGISGGGCHLMGKSSEGKSTTQYAGGSVWGGGGKHGYVQSWKSSSVGLEYLSEYHNDNFLGLDEIGLANPKEIGQSVYMIVNGCGKTRGQAEGGLRKQPTWTVFVLSSGEKTLKEYMAEADQKIMDGQEVRLIHLPADAGAGLGVFEDLHDFDGGKEFSDHIRDQANKYYGTPIRAFLTHLISQQLVITSRQQFETYRKKFIEDNLKDKSDKLAGRAADLFAVVGFAGKLASEWGVTGWSVDEAPKAAKKLFQDWLAFRKERDGGEDAGVRRVIEFIQRHGASRFQFVGDDDQSVNGEKVINRAGFKKYEVVRDNQGKMISSELIEYAIFKDVFRNEVCAGLDYQDVARKLKAKGLLAPADGKNLPAYRTFGDFKRDRYYVIPNVDLDSIGIA